MDTLAECSDVARSLQAARVAHLKRHMHAVDRSDTLLVLGRCVVGQRERSDPASCESRIAQRIEEHARHGGGERCQTVRDENHGDESSKGK